MKVFWSWGWPPFWAVVDSPAVVVSAWTPWQARRRALELTERYGSLPISRAETSEGQP